MYRVPQLRYLRSNHDVVSMSVSVPRHGWASEYGLALSDHDSISRRDSSKQHELVWACICYMERNIKVTISSEQFVLQLAHNHPRPVSHLGLAPIQSPLPRSPKQKQECTTLRTPSRSQRWYIQITQKTSNPSSKWSKNNRHICRSSFRFAFAYTSQARR